MSLEIYVLVKIKHRRSAPYPPLSFTPEVPGFRSKCTRDAFCAAACARTPLRLREVARSKI
ncbi:hypothetical protein PUN28_009616 [Cardiocondyla obscurior]|uniref:Uncharacterized protein n=1 Tax=Cardiocondyla obscurior TaxID=286306 RepID=A0AAW2FUK1_9HYME